MENVNKNNLKSNNYQNAKVINERNERLKLTFKSNIINKKNIKSNNNLLIKNTNTSNENRYNVNEEG